MRDELGRVAKYLLKVVQFGLELCQRVRRVSAAAALPAPNKELAQQRTHNDSEPFAVKRKELFVADFLQDGKLSRKNL